MTVVPGAGGQRFLRDEAPKIGEARPVLVATDGRGEVHVDGGVNRETAATVGSYGPDVLVVGSALFQRGRDTADEVDMVRRLAWTAASEAAQTNRRTVALGSSDATVERPLR
jgi:ribulose-phosphate 3-epimerase